MMKMVVKLDLKDDKAKRKVMKAVVCLSGVYSVSVDMKEKKMIVIGDVDAVNLTRTLRKICHAEMISVGPAEKKKEEPKKEEEKKKEEPKKEEEKKTGEPKKEEEKKTGEPKKEEEKKKEPKKEEEKNKEPKKEEEKKTGDQISELVTAFKAYNPHLNTHYYVQSADENPNACVIC